MIIIRFMKEYSIIHNRIKKNLKSRKNLVKNSKVTAYRLYEKDIPEYPYIIDVFNDYAVVYEKGKKITDDNPEESSLRQEHQSNICDALVENLGIPENKIIFKVRKKQKGKSQYEQIKKVDQFFTVSENGMEFLVNVQDYLDPGLFLDHRPLREIINKTSRNKSVLNLFAYTGSISVAAALGGAAVTTVDMSKTYLNWAEENFEVNDIDFRIHQFIQADVIQYIEKPLKQKYDIIVLDPPSFSNSKRMDNDFDVQTDHGEMVQTLMTSLKSNGVLYFSNNYRKFKLDADIYERYDVKDITLKSIPKDFRDLKIHVCFEIKNK